MPSAVPCIPSATRFCASVDPFAGENGYYTFAGFDGPLPELEVRVGSSYLFDQTDETNWFHPLGFAYYPDGENGVTWGAAGQEEVEGVDKVKYLIDGELATSCPAHVMQAGSGDTGLGCYEPAFMEIAPQWRDRSFSVNLTITPELAANTHGGAIYYFCHLHSQMSGRIRVLNADGTPYNRTDGLDEGLAYLPPPTVSDALDLACGTFGTSPYHPGGPLACGAPAFGGTLDTTFEQCLQAIDCQMTVEMWSRSSADPVGVSDKVRLFMEQMIPHHQNAISMARLLLKHVPTPTLAATHYDDGEGGTLPDLLWSIVNEQAFQVHAMRHYLAVEDPHYFSPSPPGQGKEASSPAVGGGGHREAAEDGMVIMWAAIGGLIAGAIGGVIFGWSTQSAFKGTSLCPPQCCGACGEQGGRAPKPTRREIVTSGSRELEIGRVAPRGGAGMVATTRATPVEVSSVVVAEDRYNSM